MELITNIFYFIMGVCVGVFFYAPSGSPARRRSKESLIGGLTGIGAVVLFVVLANICAVNDACVNFVNSKLETLAKLDRLDRAPAPPRHQTTPKELFDALRIPYPQQERP